MKCRKILASLFSLGLVLSPMCVHADDTVVAESYSNGSIKTYSDYQSAWIAALHIDSKISGFCHI